MWKLGWPDGSRLLIPSSEEMRQLFDAERIRYLRFRSLRKEAEEQERAANHAMGAWANLLQIYYGEEVKWPD